MNYIYNIEVNLKEKLINFYEWNSSDILTKVDRIPLYLVSSKDYIHILNMNIKLNKKINLVNNMCLFTNSVDVICVMFTNDGIIEKISKLKLIDESDVLDEISEKNKIELDYKIINKSNNYSFNPRYEENIVNELLEYVKSKKEDNNIIDYLYYEWFSDKKCNNKYEKLIKSINKKHSVKHDKLYKIIELIKNV